MRVALVTRSVGRGTGTSGYTHNLASELSARGHDVHVWCAERRVPGGLAYRLRELPGPARGGWVGLSIRAWLSRSIRDQCYDVVHGLGRTLGHDVFRASGGAHAAWLSHKPVRQWTVRDRIELAIDRRACREAKRVICPSRQVAGDLMAHYDIPSQQLVEIRNGVDGQTFKPDLVQRARLREEWGVGDGGRVVMFFGHGFARKGLATAVEAFERIAVGSDRFAVMGDDPRADLFRRRVSRRLGTRLLWLGPTTNPEKWLPGADATVLPTRYDAGANTTLEALACGVPVVTSDRDGNSEVAPSEELVVGAGAGPRVWARALTFALAGGASLSRACREASCSWTVERNGRETEAVYREVVDG